MSEGGEHFRQEPGVWKGGRGCVQRRPPCDALDYSLQPAPECRGPGKPGAAAGGWGALSMWQRLHYGAASFLEAGQLRDADASRHHGTCNVLKILAAVMSVRRVYKMFNVPCRPFLHFLLHLCSGDIFCRSEPTCRPCTELARIAAASRPWHCASVFPPHSTCIVTNGWRIRHHSLFIHFT